MVKVKLLKIDCYQIYWNFQSEIRDKCNDPDISFNDVVQCIYIAGDI